MKLKAKKLVALLSAMVLAMALGMTAFAAGSASTSGVVSGAASASDKNGNSVKVTISEASVSAPSQETIKALLGDAYVDGMRVVDIMDVSVPTGTAFPVTIAFSVPGVTTDNHVAVLHYNGSAWEVVDSHWAEGVVTATFNSLSPVAIVADTAAAAEGSAAAASGTASPKTGETAPVALISVLALLAVGAAYGLKKKAY